MNSSFRIDSCKNGVLNIVKNVTGAALMIYVVQLYATFTVILLNTVLYAKLTANS